MKNQREAERLRQVVAESLDTEGETRDLARCAFQSRTQLHRVFRGMLAHLITFNSYRRLTAAAVLRGLGVDDVGFGDPIEYERQAAGQ